MALPLNPAQRAAVETSSGPLLVLAGAGTGKTRVVTARIARLIRRGVDADRILAVTFTNKAAAEMQERVRELIGKRRRKKPEISTFHSLCVRILRRHIGVLGYPARFTIYDRSDQEAAARAALREIKVPGETLRPGDLLAQISRWKSSGVRAATADRQAETDREHLAAAAYRRYQRNLKSAGAVDFDDLLLLVETLFTRHAPIRRAEAERFDHVLVDEYQDTNASQYRIVRSLASGHRNLCVVGDDDQAIYGWRGAEVTHILRFKHDWKGAKVVRLEENYRSTPQIIEMANRLIGYNTTRHDKQLRAVARPGPPPQVWQFPDEEEEARRVVAHIKGRVAGGAVKPLDVAILFRTNEQPRAFETALRQAELPYRLVGGMSFFDRKEVRDLLAYLKLLADPRDEVSLLRIVNTPPRGIGQATVERLLAEAVDRGAPLWEVFEPGATRSDITPPAREGIAGLVRVVREFRDRAAREPLGPLVRDLITTTGYERELVRIYDNPRDLDTRMAAVEELINAAAGFQRPKGRKALDAFLEQIALSSRDDDKPDDGPTRNAITLMTLHAAKGLEFPEVYLVGMEEGLLPHRRAIEADDKSIDEERRLAYVGVTRARERLALSLALTRRKWGSARPTRPSRFLYEMTGQADHPEAEAAREGRPVSKRGRQKRAVKR